MDDMTWNIRNLNGKDFNPQNQSSIPKDLPPPFYSESEKQKTSYNFDNLLSKKTENNRILIDWAIRTFNLMYVKGPTASISPGYNLPTKESAAIYATLSIRDMIRSEMTLEEAEVFFTQILDRFKETN